MGGWCVCGYVLNVIISTSSAKNLGMWVKHFIRNMEEVSEYWIMHACTHAHTHKHTGLWRPIALLSPFQIQQLTGDTDFSVVIVDFNSSDIDVRAELERSRLAQ